MLASKRTSRRLVSVLTGAVLTVPTLAACSGDEPGAAEGRAPEEVLAEASSKLTETSGVYLTLTADQLPDGVSGIAKAAGTVTSAPAFDGSISVVFAGQSADVPVIAVDGKVFAQLPFTGGKWDKVNPKEYGAPDPASLVGADGFPGLPRAHRVPRGGRERARRVGQLRDLHDLLRHGAG